MIELEERPSLCVFARLAYWSAFIPVIGVALFMFLSFVSLWQIGNHGRYGLFYLSKGLTVLIVLNISCLVIYWFYPQKVSFVEAKVTVGCEQDFIHSFVGNILEVRQDFAVRSEGYVRRYFELDSHKKAFGQWVGYYDNGTKAFEGEMKADRREGKWLFYRHSPPPGTETSQVPKGESGEKLAVECHYKNGLLDGNMVAYNRRGIIMGSGAYKNGIRQGQWTEYIYFTNDVRKSTGNYENGRKNGEWLKYFNNTLCGREHYLNDLLEGDYRYGPEGSSLGTVGRYVQNTKDGKWVTHESDGSMIDELYDKGERLTYKKWNKDKLLVIEHGEKLKGNRTRSRMWYDNGQLKAVIIYQKSRTILKQTWYEDGTLKERLEDGVQIYPEWTAP